MSKLTFDHIARTGLTEAEVRRRACAFLKGANERFGRGTYSHQEAVDAVIDAAIEQAQGEVA